MSPKEKANDLLSTYRFALSIPNAPLGEYKDETAKQCALIAVDEILSMGIMSHSGDWEMAKSFWEEVKQEIKKL